MAILYFRRNLYMLPHWKFFNCVGVYDTSTLVGPLVSSPREKGKRDRRDSRGDEREEQGRKRNRNETEETEEIKKTLPLPATMTAGTAQL